MLWITLFTFLTVFSFAIWLLLVLHPDRPYRYDEVFDYRSGPQDSGKDIHFPRVSVVIPARNEEAILPETLPFITGQEYPDHEVILVDDHSTDKTRETALSIRENDPGKRLQIVQGKPLEEGWAGKLWALHQGLAHARGEWILLTDADIFYPQGLLKALVRRARDEERDMVSLMAQLRTRTRWEKLLIPAFLYFFKLLYPFKAVQNPSRKVAAAAGGCILIKKKALDHIGGIASIRNALIDDVSLAKAVKSSGFSISLLVCPDLVSQRGYDSLSGIWNMVIRSAFTELKYSYLRLVGCILSLSLTFVMPLVAISAPLWMESPQYSPWVLFTLGIITYLSIVYTYFHTIRYFALSSFWAFFLPLCAVLYLLMTVDSARRYAFGTRSSWKGRSYAR